jgi:DNA-binding CsgD family transcriptional regulator
MSPGELKALLETERTGRAFLAFRDGGGELCLFAPHGTGVISVGRRPEMDLPIPWDAEVSGLHAELNLVASEWTLLDGGLSTNGTFVNGRRVSGRVRLRDGDRLRVGRTVLAYRAERAVRTQQTLIAADLPKVELTDTQRRVLVALCRPLRDGLQATPATNQEIAEQVYLSVDAVKMHLRTLFGKFGLGDLPQNRKRATLVDRALQSEAVSHRDLD